MRLSTNTIYALNTQSVLDQQSRLSELGQKLSSGQRINKPSDDPSGASEVLGLEQSRRINEQYADTRSSAERQLASRESRLDDATGALNVAKQSLVQAGNGTLSDADRNAIADNLGGVYEQMLATANARDGNGNYLFAGNATDTAPFSGDAGELAYRGDNGSRELQVDGSRRMDVSTPGNEIFAGTGSGADYIATAGNNTGDSVYRSLDVVDATSDDYGQTFSLSFAEQADGTTTYTVTDGQGQQRSEGVYESGQTLAVGEALETRIVGEPAAGDTYTFARGREADDNILNGLADVVSALREPATDVAAQARIDNAVNRANRQVDNSLDNILSARASLGANLAEIGDLDSAGESQDIAYANRISDVRDADLPSTISDFSLARVALQAAQQTFTQVSQLSIFNR